MPSSQLVSQAPSLMLIDLIMSLSANSRNVLAVETIDVVDLTLPDNPNLRVILLLKSELVLYSTRL
jgi:hypothetical protein